ncbi:MAG: hypothetical protein KC492_14980 [Myxococcales bacterium]|nr:hypothetical protein [Myxococcales bacterium]
MASHTWKVALLCGLLLAGCGGKSVNSDVNGAGGTGAGSQGASGGSGGTTSAGQGGSKGGGMAAGGGPSMGGSSVGGSGFGGEAGSAPECFPGEENTCNCGGFSSCQPDGTWSPCDCPGGACDNDETQTLDVYGQCTRVTCIGKLGGPDFRPCVVECAEQLVGVSTGCASCLSELVECAATTCINQCLNDTTGACDACLCETGCAQRVADCAGPNTQGFPVCEVP